MKKTVHGKKSTHIGPGGINCSCCRPFAGSVKDNRKYLHKVERREVKQALKEQIKETVED